jgi:D-galactarolactone isomerase
VRLTARCTCICRAIPPFQEGPPFPLARPARRLIAGHAPERIGWGTNWPHNLAKTSADYPDDAALLDLTLGWLPSKAARHQVLVANPAELFGWPYLSSNPPLGA